MKTRALALLMVSRLEFLLTNPWLIGLVVLLTFSFGSIVVTGSKALTERRERYALDLQQRLRAAVQSAGPSGRQVDRALRVIREPSSVSQLIAGQEFTMPSGWDFGPGAIEAMPPYLSSTRSASAGSSVDGAGFIVQFGGLLALALGTINVLSDRRRGWADAERGMRIPVWLFCLVDILAVSGALAIVVGAWFGTAWLVIHQLLDHEWDSSGQAIWALAPHAWCYLVAFYGYGAAIGWYVRSPFRAVASAAMLWATLVLVAPQVVLTWSSWGADVPSRGRVEQDQRDTYLERVRNLEADLGRQIAPQVTNAKTPIEKEQQITIAFQSLEPVWAKGMAEARAEANASNSAWWIASNRLARRLQKASRFTPNTLLPQVLAEASGTGTAMSSRWQRKLDAYRAQLDDLVFDDRPTVPLGLPINGKIEAHGHVRHPLRPFRDLPQFVVPMTTPKDRWEDAQDDAVVLLLHALVAVLLSGVAQWHAWRRYDLASLS